MWIPHQQLTSPPDYSENTAHPQLKHLSETTNLDEPDGLPRVFYISEVPSGGSLKYINDIKTFYSVYGFEFIRLSSAENAMQHTYQQGDILFFQYLFYTDFTFDFLTSLIDKFKLRLVVPVHDRYWLGPTDEVDVWVHNINPTSIPPTKYEFLSKAEVIIFPSHHIYNVFHKLMKFQSMTVVPHIDIVSPPKECQPPVENEVLNLGIITDATFTKGTNLLEGLMAKAGNENLHFFLYNEYKNELPHVTVRGTYNETDIFHSLVEDKIHGLLFLNNFPETYSYALTKGIYSGLPILYTKMGAIQERLEALNQSMHVGTSASDLEENFLFFLQLLRSQDHVPKNECKLLPPSKIPIHIDKAYDKIFFEASTEAIMEDIGHKHTTNSKAYRLIHKSLIQPYAVYFPQFHPVPENNANFYAGYTDMVNLAKAKVEDPTLWTPLRNVLGMYDLVRDTGVIPKQMEIARAYGLAGFAIYYYWFSVNTVTGEHTVFTKVIDQFFERKQMEDFSVFFVWCNEDWTSNVAFQSGESLDLIVNKYDDTSFTANIQHLVQYFKHDIYRKVENQPLLFIHHSHLMSTEEIVRMQRIGDEVTMLHGFDGLKLVLNGSYQESQSTKMHTQYNYHPHYKGSNLGQFMDDTELPRKIDYQAYTRNYIKNRGETGDTPECINSVFVNFDNTPRFFAHSDTHEFGEIGTKANFMTRTKNHSVKNFEDFLNAQFDLYDGKPDEASRIFLINAWNEWGEQMALEPSQEKGFQLLDTFQGALLTRFRLVEKT